jgi:hypothetical protein
MQREDGNVYEVGDLILRVVSDVKGNTEIIYHCIFTNASRLVRSGGWLHGGSEGHHVRARKSAVRLLHHRIYLMSIV